MSSIDTRRESDGARPRRSARPAALIAAALAAVLLPSAAWAQGTPAPPVPPDSGPPRVTAGWQDGFVVQSDDGDFRLQVGLLLQADGRFAPGDDADAVTDAFLIRRARPYLRGRLGRRFEFYLNPDFAGGTLVLQDAYLDTVFSRAFRVRVGKAKTPFGLERLHSSSNLLFYERALPSALAPNRDVGVQVVGEVAGGLVNYAGGVMNGAADGGSTDSDTGDSKDVAGRIVFHPAARHTAGPLRGLGVGFAGTRGRQTGSGALAALRTSSVQQRFFSYADAAADGVRTRYSPQVFYYYKAFAALGEYVNSRSRVRQADIAGEVVSDAWQVAVAYVITGETATDAGAGIRPRASFGSGGYGAFQVAARYHALAVDRRALDRGLAAPGSSRTADAWSLGLNWILTPNLKYVVNLERTVFDGEADGPRAAENALVFRAQVNF